MEAREGGQEMKVKGQGDLLACLEPRRPADALLPDDDTPPAFPSTVFSLLVL